MINRLLNFVTAIIILVIGVLVVGLGWLIWRVGEEVVGAIDRHAGDLVWLVLGGVVIFAAVLVILSASFWVVGALRNSLHRIWPKNGLLPAIETGRGQWQSLNETGAQSLGVIVSAEQKQSAAMAGRVLREHYQQRFARPPEPPQVEAPPQDGMIIDAHAVVRDVNLRTDPHWLLIGATGSGKTTASYAILDAMAKRNPCRFVVCEPGGINWNAQATAMDTLSIARTIQDVYQEMERRQEMLRRYDVSHVEELPGEPLPYIVLVNEEMESVLDDLRLVDRDLRTATIVALRTIARQGRKPGIVLFAVTQAGTTDVFDAHVRKNMTNVLLFQSEHTVNEMWRLPGVRLSELPAGTAYSVKHASMVHFPMAARPSLPLLSGPQPAQPVAQNTPTTAHNQPQPAVEAVVTRLEPGRQPDAATAAHMRRLYAEGWSLNRLCDAFYGYKDGIVFGYVKQAVGARPRVVSAASPRRAARAG